MVLVAGAALLGSHGAAEAQTPQVSFSLSAGSIREGGAGIVATVTASGRTFPADRTIDLEWDGATLTNGLIQGPGNTSAFPLLSGQTSVNLALSVPDDATGLVYFPDTTANVTATHGGTEIGSAALMYVDSDGKPPVTIAAASERVFEGGDIVLTATLAHPVAASHTVELTTTDTYGARTGTVPSGFNLAAHQSEATVTAHTADNTQEKGRGTSRPWRLRWRS